MFYFLFTPPMEPGAMVFNIVLLAKILRRLQTARAGRK
jgi:hypothetical protein